jgi:predicted metal-dependent phosphotriesterase family hydrolase
MTEVAMARIETVLGPIDADRLGLTLVHEHVMVDFVGATETGPHRWDVDEVVATMLPYLQQAQAHGVRTLVECTPMYLGRDVRVLVRLAEATGMHILTNTGLYKEPHLPAEVHDLTPEELACRWIEEWSGGIEGTGVRPSFVKIAVNKGPLVPIQRKIVRAAALTHLATGLSVVCHTNDPVAAHMALDLIEAEGMRSDRYTVAHAQNITDLAEQDRLASRGCWLAFDGVGGVPDDEMLVLVTHALEQGREERMLLSHDAGWYHVGEPGGGSVRPYTALFERFLPALRARGAGDELLNRLMVANPQQALTII